MNDQYAETTTERTHRWCAYFAYGSNLDVGQMADRCPNAIAGPPAILEDHQLEFAGRSQIWGGHGVANVEAATPGNHVPGRLWWVTPSDLRKLDRYEGHPRVYKRSKLLLLTMLPDGTMGHVEAWVYAKPAGVPLRPPSPEYAKVIQGGLTAAGHTIPGPAGDALGGAILRALDAEEQRVVNSIDDEKAFWIEELAYPMRYHTA